MSNLEVIREARKRLVAEQNEVRDRLAKLDEAQLQGYDAEREPAIRSLMFKLVSLSERATALDRTEAFERSIGGR